MSRRTQCMQPSADAVQRAAPCCDCRRSLSGTSGWSTNLRQHGSSATAESADTLSISECSVP
eukprot:6177711-Pleurochrysis_carterae.AAC.1